MTEYYRVTLLFLCLPLVVYPLFRFSVDDYLRRHCHLDKRAFRRQKKQKGRANFWWYEHLHRAYGFPLLYFFNKIFTILFPILFLLHFALGRFRIMSIPITLLLLVLVACMLVMSAFFYINHLICEFGTWKVLLRRNSHKGMDSILFVAAFVYGFLVIGFLQLQNFLRLWS